MSYSLIDIFGELPVHPDKFATLDPKLKWLSTPIEGGCFCVTCGTLDPKTPRAHHKECCSFMDADSFPKYENPLGECPSCDGDDLGIDSSREMGWSVILCSDCGYRFEGRTDEETLTERFLARITK